ncbi:MAG: hypothetical protein ACLU3I_09630 [Acutalibacteraceae bacterium]
MKFDAFDKTEQARFTSRGHKKVGGTAAYQEYHSASDGSVW